LQPGRDLGRESEAEINQAAAVVTGFGADKA